MSDSAKRMEIRISDGTTFGTNGDNLDAQLYFPKTHIDNVVGLLDENEKLSLSLFPAIVFGGQKHFDTINANATAKELFGQLLAAAVTAGWETPDDALNMGGRFFQIAGNITIDLTSFINDGAGEDPRYTAIYGASSTVTFTFNVTGDDGASASGSIALENNDYLVLNTIAHGTADEYSISFGVINNTYQDATESLKGVVHLASNTDVTTGTNTTKAVTPAGAKLAVQTFGYAHPTYNPAAQTFGTLKTITAITITNGHIEAITTGDIQSASESQLGVVQRGTSTEVKAASLDDAKVPSLLKTRQMIDYWGAVPYYASLAAANTDVTAGTLSKHSGRMIFVAV